MAEKHTWSPEVQGGMPTLVCRRCPVVWWPDRQEPKRPCRPRPADTTPDRLAWIDTAAETAAAERQARYQETACARRPAEERPDA